MAIDRANLAHNRRLLRAVVGDLSRLTRAAKGGAQSTRWSGSWALKALKEELGMEVDFVSEFDRRRMVLRRLVGDGGSFGWREGESIPSGSPTAASTARCAT
jgi:hypothetical protein